MPLSKAAALLAAAALLCAATAAAQQTACAPTCVLTQCPCYGGQVDDGSYARPPGCVAQVPIRYNAGRGRMLESACSHG
jgi:hypothetical protein